MKVVLKPLIISLLKNCLIKLKVVAWFLAEILETALKTVSVTRNFKILLNMTSREYFLIGLVL